MIIIEERNSAVNKFYDKLKETHNNLYLSNVTKVVEDPWENNKPVVNNDIIDREVEFKVTFCNDCNHAGNPESMADWFKKSSYCPVVGCNCKCRYGNLANWVTAYDVKAAVQKMKEENSKRLSKEYSDFEKGNEYHNSTYHNSTYHNSTYHNLTNQTTTNKVISLRQYNHWAEGIENGTITYNPFLAKPYLEFGKKLSEEHNRKAAELKRKREQKQMYRKMI